jgi:PAS domain S-box-containing protein
VRLENPSKGELGLSMTPISKPRVLIIDDDPQDRSLASVLLSRRLPEAQIQEIDGAAEFARELRRGSFDLVVTEMQLAWSDGFEILESLRDAKARVPVIAFTDLRDEEFAVEGMKSGLADLVFKSSKGYLRLPEAAVEALERAEQQLLVARSEPWLGTLLDRANVGAFRTTLDQRLIESTPAVLRLLGVRNVQDALRVKLPEPFFVNGSTEELRELLGDESALQSREVQVKRPDGANVWLSLTELLLVDVDGEMVIDSLVRDVSHLKDREDAFRGRVEDLERSNADLSEFAYIASHELQEPLRMVEKFGSLLAEDFGNKLGTEGGELLGFVVDGALRMQSLIDDLLALSRINSEGQDFEECDAGELVERAMVNLSDRLEENQAEIDVEPLPTIEADVSQLVQLWQNLLSNAIKFRGAEAPHIRIAAEEGDDEWVFSVEDNGVGIEPEEAETIFTIFRRLHPDLPGTGIGLTICKRIVDRHGGRIWFEPSPSGGSIFRFSIPIQETATPPEADEATDVDDLVETEN